MDHPATTSPPAAMPTCRHCGEPLRGPILHSPDGGECFCRHCCRWTETAIPIRKTVAVSAAKNQPAATSSQRRVRPIPRPGEWSRIPLPTTAKGEQPTTSDVAAQEAELAESAHVSPPPPVRVEKAQERPNRQHTKPAGRPANPALPASPSPVNVAPSANCNDEPPWPPTEILQTVPARETDNPEYWTTRRQRQERRRRQITSHLVSLAVHLVILLVAALIVFAPQRQPDIDGLLVRFENDAQGRKLFADDPLQQEQAADEDPQPIPQPVVIASASAVKMIDRAEPQSAAVDNIRLNLELGTTPAPNPVTSGGSGRSPAQGRSQGSGWNFPLGQGLEGRRLGVRSQLAALSGGTPASEQAVERGLVWLAHHQQVDGSWSFHHEHPRCPAECDPMGRVDASTAATGLALLCFLGAGYTHQEGPYQENVQQGLNWLVSHSVDGDLRWDRALRPLPEMHTGMYAQGIAAMALNEAYGMTDDKSLKEPAWASIRFILDAQDRSSGGWRYEPNEGGDTSVFGWQIMALISARMAGIEVTGDSRNLANRFLRSVYISQTGHFGYMSPRRVTTATTATTAIGDLCSLYLQSTLKRNDLDRAVRQLSSLSPRAENEYANYYISQVLHHFGGEAWKDWNVACRDFLVETQHQNGHTAGSWDPRGRWGLTAGRLYATCMHVLTLEVYYRHLPLYRHESFELVMETKEERARVARQEARQKQLDTFRGTPEDLPPPPSEPVTVASATATVNPPPVNPPPVAPPTERVTGQPTEQTIQTTPAKPKSQPQAAQPEPPGPVAPPEVPLTYIRDYPIADRWCAPIRSFFDDASRTSTVDDRGRVVGQHPNGGFGLPLLQRGKSVLLHTGGDYGWFQEGEAVHAAANGIVRMSTDPAKARLREMGIEVRRNAMDWGSMIVIEHRTADDRHYLTLYAHLGLDRRVQVGDVVAAGQQIGTIGKDSGAVNGGYDPHLHFGVREGRLIDEDSTLFVVPVAGELTRAQLETLETNNEDQISIVFDGYSPDSFILPIPGQQLLVESKQGEYLLPSHVLWHMIPPDTPLAGYSASLGKWIDPHLFLRENGATVLPAIRFTPTWDREPTTRPNITGQDVPEWDVSEWIRPPADGTTLGQLKGKAVCLVAIQTSCLPSNLLAGPMLVDAARYFEGRDDIQLVLLQTTFSDFRRNSAPNLKKSSEALPESIAVGHVGGLKEKPPLLDEFGQRGTPWTVLIDPAGKVRFSGVLTDSAQLIRMLREMTEPDELTLAE